MSEFSHLPIVAEMATLGFRLRIHPWSEEKIAVVIGWDVPKFVDCELPPQIPPCGFFFTLNERSSVEKLMRRTARASVRFYWTPYIFALAKLCFLKALYFYFPHHLTKHEMSSNYIFNWVKNAEARLECKDRIKFWIRQPHVPNKCLTPIDLL